MVVCDQADRDSLGHKHREKLWTSGNTCLSSVSHSIHTHPSAEEETEARKPGQFSKVTFKVRASNPGKIVCSVGCSKCQQDPRPTSVSL